MIPRALLVATSAAVCLAFAPVAHAASDPLTAPWHRVEPDKRLHVGVEFGFGAEWGAFLNLAISSSDPHNPEWQKRSLLDHLGWRVFVPAAIVFSFGVGKELLDEEEYLWPTNPAWNLGDYRRTEGWSAGDLAADAVGSLAGATAGAVVGHGIGFALRPACLRFNAWSNRRPDGMLFEVGGRF